MLLRTDMVKLLSKHIHKGFTLIEVLIVVGLLAIVSLVALNIILITLRTDSKATASSNVQQAGNLIINQFTNLMLGEDKIYGFSSSTSVDCRSGACDTDCTLVNPIRSIQLEEASTSTPIRFECPDTGNISITDLTNPTPTPLYYPTSIQVSACSITCSPSTDPTTGPFLTLSFTLCVISNGSPLCKNTVAPGDQVAEQSFTTSVVMRNK